MSRPIDADALVAEIKHISDACNEGYPVFLLAVIYQQPTIDAVPVVRCKDCRYSDDYYNDGSCCCKHPERGMRYIGTDWNWFCADGERKEENA